jgi:hypothetical protein
MLPNSTLIAASILVLAGCAPGENDPGPGGVTVGEAKALDEAAEMLDARRSPSDGAARIAAPLPPSPTPARAGE